MSIFPCTCSQPQRTSTCSVGVTDLPQLIWWSPCVRLDFAALADERVLRLLTLQEQAADREWLGKPGHLDGRAVR